MKHISFKILLFLNEGYVFLSENYDCYFDSIFLRETCNQQKTLTYDYTLALENSTNMLSQIKHYSRKKIRKIDKLACSR